MKRIDLVKPRNVFIPNGSKNAISKLKIWQLDKVIELSKSTSTLMWWQIVLMGITIILAGVACYFSYQMLYPNPPEPTQIPSVLRQYYPQ